MIVKITYLRIGLFLCSNRNRSVDFSDNDISCRNFSQAFFLTINYFLYIKKSYFRIKEGRDLVINTFPRESKSEDECLFLLYFYVLLSNN